MINQCKSFLNFILDKHSTRNQIQFLFSNPANKHIEVITEIIYNLLENKNIKKSPKLIKEINQHKNILKKFIGTIQKSFIIQKKLLKKYFRLFYRIIRLSKNIIIQ